MYYETKKKIKSNIDYVKIVVNEILVDINGILNDNQKFNTRLILSELLVNSIQHGNHLDMSKYVYINIKIEKDLMKIKISDEGSGFEYDIKDYEPYNFEDSGRGLVLVEGLSDKLLIKGNTVTAIKYL